MMKFSVAVTLVLCILLPLLLVSLVCLVACYNLPKARQLTVAVLQRATEGAASLSGALPSLIPTPFRAGSDVIASR